MDPTAKQEYRRALFSVAHTDVSAMPFNNHGRTLRLVVRCNARARGLQVVFSNRCGTAPLPVGAASLALCDEAGVLQPDTLMPLTVGGVLAFELPPGQDVLSDEVRFPVAPGEHFAINLYYPGERRVQSGNWVGRGALRSRPGNYSADLTLPGPGLVSRFARTVIVTDITVQVTTVAQVVGICDEPGRVVGCFGDSIIQQSNWTEPFARLLERRWPGEVTLCNLGIGGNRLLAGSPPSLGGVDGVAGVERFEHDLLGLEGLTHAVVGLGANDVGLPGSHGLPEDDVPTTEAYTAAMRNLADRLHQRGVKVYCPTITPRWVTPPFTAEREAIRQEWNAWIRTADCFDAVLDFDKVLSRPDGKPGMRDGWALPDGLHPTPLGGLMMAKSIDLDLFGEGGNG